MNQTPNAPIAQRANMPKPARASSQPFDVSGEMVGEAGIGLDGRGVDVTWGVCGICDGLCTPVKPSKISGIPFLFLSSMPIAWSYFARTSGGSSSRYY